MVEETQNLTEQEPTQPVEEEETPSLVGETSAETEETEEKDGNEESSSEVPEKYEVKLEGMEVDVEMLEGLTPVFKELKLGNDAVQKLSEKFAPLIAKREESLRQASLNSYKELVEGWKTETIKQLGVDSKKSLAFAAKARDKFGSKGFIDMANETGIGNHPEFVNFLIAVGKTISEDKFPDGNSGGKVDPLKVLYPTMNKGA